MKPLLQIVSSVAVSALASLLFFSALMEQKLDRAESELQGIATLERQRIEEARQQALVAIAEERARMSAPLRDPSELPPELKAERAPSIDKNAAWAAWYQVPEQCGLEVSQTDFVGCVNHKMRAKQEFERLWQQDPEALGRNGG